MRRSNKKKNKLMLLLVLLLTISLGYALLSTTLKINGSAIIAKNNWNIYWENVQVNQGSVNPTNIPVIGQDQNEPVDTKVTWSTTLSLPGDFYEFTVDAVNAGTIDAMITDITPTIPNNLPNYVSYSVTYDDGVELALKHLLPKKNGNVNTTQKYKVRVEFLNTITPEQMNQIPEEGLVLDFGLEVTYGQATDEAIVKPLSSSGFYDSNDNLLMSYSTFASTYNFDISRDQEKIYMKNPDGDDWYGFDINSSQPEILAFEDIPDDVVAKIIGSNPELINTVKIVVPEGPNKIGNFVFSGFTNLTDIVLPSSITEIGDYAFIGTGLRSVNLPSNITKIGMGAFASCSSLTEINIPKGVTSIGISAFASSGLTSITIPNSVTSIGQSAFNSCENLESITFEENSKVSTIDETTFGWTTKLKSIKIPASVTSIGHNAFYDSGIEKVTFESGSQLNIIGRGAFYECSELEEVEIPNGVTVIGNTAFDYTSLEEVTIPNTVITIESGAFANITTLETVIFEENSHLNSIESAAFMNDSALANITIPDSVTSIDSAFQFCTSLKSINIPANVTMLGDGCFVRSGLTSITFANPRGWYYRDTLISEATLSNPTNAAIALVNTYVVYDLTRTD